LKKTESYRKVIFRMVKTVGLLFMSLPLLTAQEEFHKPSRRSENQLDIGGPFLKTIYSFTPYTYDTFPQPGPDPLVVPRYMDRDLIPIIFDAVFDGRVRAYNPNFWGTLPQLIEKSCYDEFDTLDILKYLGAGWDTSLVIDNNGKMSAFPVHHEIPFEEIGGIFFFESWWLDQKNCRMYKDIIAYLPIRAYMASVYDGYETSELRRRLLFMVIPEWSSGNLKQVKYKPGDFRLVRKDVRYEMSLFNKPYEMYLNREENYGQISQAEFNEWQYHRFDFYRYFDPDLFLEKIISLVLEGRLRATLPEMYGIPLSRKEFIKILQNLPGTEDKDPAGDSGNVSGDSGNISKDPSLPESGLTPEDYHTSDLNSIVFGEDWYINPVNLQIYKEVKSITVNRTETKVDRYTGEFIQGSVNPIFTVWF
jgi:hypothetical protein